MGRSPLLGRSGSVVVSIHDVAPSTLPEVRWLLGELDRLAVRPRVLKVVPCLDGREEITGSPELVELLRAEAAAGSEIVQHGMTHRVAGPLRIGGADGVRARLFAGDAPEMATLSRGAMWERIAAGHAILAGAGLPVRGFCAPGWLAAPELEAVLAGLGFDFNVTMTELHDVREGSILRTPPVGYMGAPGIQERLVGIGGGLALAAGLASPVVKVYFHPQGAPESADCRRWLDVLERLLRVRRPATFGELIDSERAS